MNNRQIKSIKAREILDSRGEPTVEAVVILNDGAVGRACVPSEKPCGKLKAPELRDGDFSRYGGKGVQQAIRQISSLIAPQLIGHPISCQLEIDTLLEKITTHQPAANSTLAVSLACARAAALSFHLPLRKYLGGFLANILPMPMMTLLQGGSDTDNLLDIQELMVIPSGASSLCQAVEWGTRIHRCLKQMLKEKKLSTSSESLGGFSPEISSAKDALELVLEAVERSGLIAEKDITFGIDASASQWVTAPYQDTDIFETHYTLPKSLRSFTGEQLISYWEALCSQYPITFLEDPLGESDWQGFVRLTHQVGSRVQVAGGALFASSSKHIREGAGRKACNSIVIKPIQAATLSKVSEAVSVAKTCGMLTCLSHCQGETSDGFLADLAVALGVGQIKAGALCSIGSAQYNQLLRIEENLKKEAVFAAPKLLRSF